MWMPDWPRGVCVQFGIASRSVRGRFGVGLVWFLVDLELVWSRFMISLKFEVGLASILNGLWSVWGRFGVGLWSVWDRFGIGLEWF